MTEMTVTGSFSYWQVDQPLTHERSLSSWGLKRQRGGWWGASGNPDWVWTWPQPLLEPPVPAIKDTTVLTFKTTAHCIHTEHF